MRWWLVSCSCSVARRRRRPLQCRRYLARPWRPRPRSEFRCRTMVDGGGLRNGVERPPPRRFVLGGSNRCWPIPTVYALGDLAIHTEASTRRSQTVGQLGLWPSRKSSPHQASEPIAELLRVERTLAFEYARLIKQKMRHILFELALAVVQAGDRDDNIVTRIDLQDRLCASREASGASQHFLQLPIRPFFGSDQARDAVGQPVRRTHIRHCITQGILDEGDEF